MGREEGRGGMGRGQGAGGGGRGDGSGARGGMPSAMCIPVTTPSLCEHST